MKGFHVMGRLFRVASCARAQGAGKAGQTPARHTGLTFSGAQMVVACSDVIELLRVQRADRAGRRARRGAAFPALSMSQAPPQQVVWTGSIDPEAAWKGALSIAKLRYQPDRRKAKAPPWHEAHDEAFFWVLDPEDRASDRQINNGSALV